MNLSSQRLGLVVALTTAMIALVALLSTAPHLPAHAQGQTTPPDPQAKTSPAGSASLHNPTFDNHDWYEFNRRYQSAYPAGSWLPDDDNNLNDDIPESSRQDWRLWFQNGTDIVETDPEQVYAHSIEGVQIRPYGGGHQLAGLYQVIYNTTPCLVYQFQMYGQSRPEGGDTWAVLQVGIDQVGWHPDSTNDPAVHAFPSTTVWGPSHDYKWTYGPLTVTAEALNTQITVFTYADSPGGRSHRILWDTGSFQDVTPAMIHDPDNLPSPGGISNLSVTPGSTTAQVTWTTAEAALGQVYYRKLPTPGSPPTGTVIFQVYLPLVARSGGVTWQATPLNKTPTTSHSETITGLEPDSTYAYIVVSRGLSGGQCVTWVSSEQQFTTTP